jgi:glycosyltransferase involved in cell wall biosynthesis
VKSRNRDDSVDDAAIAAFRQQYGERATQLPALALVIAAYNEEGSIGQVVGALPDTIAGLTTVPVVVADGCVDATAKEAAEAGALVCDVPVNRGQGAALRLGYRLAREGGAAYIVTTDADGQYNPAEIASLMVPLLAGQADFVSGSRALGSEETTDPVRRLGVRVFALIISALAAKRITDPSFGLRAMRSEVTGAVDLRQPQYQSAELLIAIISHGYRIAEVPATIHKRRVGESKKGHNAFYAMHFAKVIAGTWWHERQRRARSSRPAGAAATGTGSVSKAAGPASSAAPSSVLEPRDEREPRSANST